MNCKRCGQEATLTELGLCAACNCCSIYILEADEYKKLLKQAKMLAEKNQKLQEFILKMGDV